MKMTPLSRLKSSWDYLQSPEGLCGILYWSIWGLALMLGLWIVFPD